MRGRRALITGAGGGICTAIAERLAADGVDLMLHGNASAETVAALGERLAATHGVAAHVVAADFADPAEIERLMTEADAALGGVDILVNGAAVRFAGLVEDLAPADWDQALAVNLSAAFHTIRHALPGMKARRWGRVVNIASTLAARGAVGRIDYVATKTALIGVTRAVALEAAGDGVTCNAVSPGTAPTEPILAKIAARAERRGLSVEAATAAHLEAAQPTGRFVATENIAALVAFLCSDAGADVTGAVLPIDGGALAG